jgi:peptide chain release factor 2
MNKQQQNSALLSIYSGVGGKDAEDWVGMLKRMYEKFFKRMEWKYKLIDEDPNDVGGYKFVSFQISGADAYEILKDEKGVHRLVRISPFSAKRLRHTSFAYVDVLPIIEKPTFKLEEKDIEIQTFRASGHGGQNVNKVESAVRVIYKPLNLVVTCQSERSQFRNKEIALNILASKIQNLLDERHKKEIAELKGEKIEIGWGNQRRSYVLDPYKLVKDLKTGKETNKVEEVLDGKLELIRDII